MGKVDNGIVSVNAYGVYCNITFPLSVKVFKPKGTLKKEDKYKTKIELASEIITELIESGFNIELVLADSLYGESSQFIQKLTEYQLAYVVAIRSNHGVWLPASQSVRANKWYASHLRRETLLQRWLVNLREHLVIKNQKSDTSGK